MRTRNPIKTPADVINSGMVTEAAKIVGAAMVPRHSPAPSAPARPCREAWERNWLELDCWHVGVQRMATEVQHFAGRWFRNLKEGRVLVLAGHTGCGKTRCLLGVHRFVRDCGCKPWSDGHWPYPPTVNLTRWPELAQALSETGVDAASLMRDCIESDLLLLDDIGAESDRFRSGHATDCLCQILSRRQERKFTLVTTNIGEGQWHHRFDVRVADRLHRNAKIVDVSEMGSYSLR